MYSSHYFVVVFVVVDPSTFSSKSLSFQFSILMLEFFEDAAKLFRLSKRDSKRKKGGVNRRRGSGREERKRRATRRRGAKGRNCAKLSPLRS